MTLGTLGNMRSLVTVEEPVETAGPTGEPVRTWRAVATAWAAIDSGPGREEIRQEDVRAACPVRIWMRVIPGFTLSVLHRLRLGTRIFDVNDVRNVQERGALWNILATEASA